MVSAVVDPGNGGPWEWRTLGMADPGNGGPEPSHYDDDDDYY